MDSSILRRTALSTAVLSLYGYQNYILVGESSILSLFNMDDKKSIMTQKIFVTAEIHGIKAGNLDLGDNRPRFLVWGQKSFRLVLLHLEELRWEFYTEEVEVEDWIVDAICFEVEHSVVLFTAHNAFLSYTISVDEAQFSIGNKTSNLCSFNKNICIQRKQCIETSLLYSGKVIGSSWTQCIGFSGTVFGIIHIWAPWTKESKMGQNATIASLSGPKGPVFSISYNDCKGLLAATSDDRSVRVWKVCFTQDNSGDFQNAWLNCYIQEIYCSYGHTARVWRSLILDDETVFTCSEDSTICHWCPKGSLQASWIAHPSSNIWCLVQHKDKIISGGSDGAVKQWKISWENHQNPENLLALNLPEKVKSTTEGEKPFRKRSNFARSLCLIDPERLVTILDSGAVWLIQKRNCHWQWRLVFEHTILKGYNVSSLSCDSSLLALGTLTGHMLVLETEKWKCICKHSVSSSKIDSILFIDQNQLITCSDLGRIRLWMIQHQVELANVTLDCTSEHKLPPCRHPWITAASLLQDGSENVNLAVGDPCGNLYLYSAKNVDPVSSMKRLHNQSPVTSVMKHNNVLYTTGRNGRVCYLAIKDGHLELLQNVKLSNETWLCGVMTIDQDLIIPSFSSDKFRLWNISKEELMAEVICGGGHRSWDLLIGIKRFRCSGRLESVTAEGIRCLTLAFLRDGAPFIWSAPSPSKFTTIKGAISGSEIHCVEPLFIGAERTLFAFGGEDTLLHIHLLVGGKLLKIMTLKSHLSSIRSLTRIDPLHEAQNDTKVVYLLSCGGRAQFKVWRLTLSDLGYSAIHGSPREDDLHGYGTNSTLPKEFLYCKEMSSHMLRPESGRTWRTSCPVIDPETRYMAALAFWMDAQRALLVLASSDGFLRFFLYDEGGDVQLVHGEDCGHVLFHLCFFRLRRCLYLTASTSRGAILTWNLEIILNGMKSMEAEMHSEDGHESLFETMTRHQVHDAGLNVIAPWTGDRDEVLLVAGGEDGSIHLLRVSPQGKEDALPARPFLVQIWSSASRHAATITGLIWVDGSHVCSASVDQRLVVWRVETSGCLAPQSAHFSLPDIHGLRALPPSLSLFPPGSEKVFVFGRGIEVWNVVKGSLSREVES